MIKRWIPLLILILALTSCFANYSLDKPVVSHLLHSAVRLRNSSASGSGVVIKLNRKLSTGFYQTLILTAGHVVYRSPYALIDVFQGDKLTTHFSRVISISYESDLALCSILTASPVEGLEEASLGNDKDIGEFEAFCVVGCPLNRRPLITRGNLIELSEDEISTTCCIASGSSGAGLFLEDGRLAGIISAVGVEHHPNLEVPLHVYFLSKGIPISAVTTWLDSIGGRFIHQEGIATPASFAR